MRYEVCYIDDRIIPVGGKVSNELGMISKSEMSDLVLLSQWEEPTVKRFLKATIEKSNKFKQIELAGFTHPNFFLNHLDLITYNPNSIILDWDFGDNKAEERIEEILNKTSSKIFILTGNELESEVENSLGEIKEKYGSRIGAVYAKSIHLEDKNTQENLLEEILSDLTSKSEKYQYGDFFVDFYASSILPTFDMFWMIESILGRDFLKRYLDGSTLEVSQNSVERMFEESNVSFFINRENSRIYSKNGLGLTDFYGDGENISAIKAIYAIKNYDLQILETAFERGTSKTFQKNGE